MFSSILLQIDESTEIIQNIGMKWVKAKNKTLKDPKLRITVSLTDCNPIQDGGKVGQKGPPPVFPL